MQIKCFTQKCCSVSGQLWMGIEDQKDCGSKNHLCLKVLVRLHYFKKIKNMRQDASMVCCLSYSTILRYLCGFWKKLFLWSEIMGVASLRYCMFFKTNYLEKFPVVITRRTLKLMSILPRHQWLPEAILCSSPQRKSCSMPDIRHTEEEIKAATQR